MSLQYATHYKLVPIRKNVTDELGVLNETVRHEKVRTSSWGVVPLQVMLG